MRLLTNLLFKVTVSSMVLTAPAMINGYPNTGGVLPDRKAELPYATSSVIKNYIDHLKIWPVRAYVDRKSMVMSFPYVKEEPAASVVPVVASVAEKKEVAVAAVAAREAAGSAKRNMAIEVRRVISESDFIYRS